MYSGENISTSEKSVFKTQTPAIERSQEGDSEITGRKLPFSSEDESGTVNGEEHHEKPPVVAIVLTSLGIIFVAIIAVVIWIYGRKRKENKNDIQLQWRERLSSNKV